MDRTTVFLELCFWSCLLFGLTALLLTIRELLPIVLELFL